MTDYPDQKTLDSIYAAFDPSEEGWSFLRSVWEKCREAGRAEKQAECDALQNLADKNTILIEAIEAKYTALQHKIDASPVAWLNGEWFHTVPVEPKDRA